MKFPIEKLKVLIRSKIDIFSNDMIPQMLQYQFLNHVHYDTLHLLRFPAMRINIELPKK